MYSNSVSFVRIAENSVNSMEQAINRALNLIGFSFNSEIRNVIIKPNLCYYWDYSTAILRILELSLH